MQYFTVERIKQAIRHLNQFESGWVLGSLVWAANDVDLGTPKSLRPQDWGVGTDAFLDKFFSPHLLELPAKGQRQNLRPIFADMGSLPSSGDEGDYVTHQATKIWGNVFSQTFVKSSFDKGLITKTAAGTALTTEFQSAFEQNLSADFRFEELLVWLHAFNGFPDQIGSWDELLTFFQQTYMGGRQFPLPFQSRFFVGGPDAPAWPTMEIISSQPSTKELHAALLPSTFAEGLTGDNWKAIKERLAELTLQKFDGVEAADASLLASAAIASLASTKRLFLLGDPGTGKSTFADLILQAFIDVLTDSRLLEISVEVTARTSETTLIGFIGLDGQWIPGALTEPRGGRTLLRSATGTAAAGARRQVNFVILNEANRTDAESLLARLQRSLDSLSSDPGHRDHLIALGASGDFYLSPATFVVLTGNSPRDDYGRVEQSRPFKRRLGLLQLPNPLSTAIQDDTDVEFGQRLMRTWVMCQSESLLEREVDRVQFAGVLMAAEFASARAALREVLGAVNAHRAGLSYGILRKLLLMTANDIALAPNQLQTLTEQPVQVALDGALTAGLAGVLASAAPVDGRSIREALLEGPAFGATFPRFYQWIDTALSSVGDLGSVEAVF